MSQQHTAAASSLLAIEINRTDHRIDLTLRGQADVSTQERMRSAFDRVDADGVKHLELRLHELDFCDVASAREIIDLAYAVRSNGGTVRVSETPNTVVHTMLVLLDVAGDLGLAPLNGQRDGRTS
jgi:anti-anti-sigma factor